MFVAMTSGDVGRCTVQPELVSSKVSRCVPDKEAGDEERKMRLRRFELSTDVIITIGFTYNVSLLPTESLCGYLVKRIRIA